MPSGTSVDCLDETQTPGPLHINELETPIDVRDRDPGPTLRYLAGGNQTQPQTTDENCSIWNGVHSTTPDRLSRHLCDTSTRIDSNDGIPCEKHTNSHKEINKPFHFDSNDVDKQTQPFDAMNFVHNFVRKYSNNGDSKVSCKYQNKPILTELSTPTKNRLSNESSAVNQISNYNVRMPPLDSYSDNGISKFDFSILKSNIDSIINSTPMRNSHYLRNYSNEPAEFTNTMTPNRYQSTKHSMRSVTNGNFLNDDISTLTCTSNESPYSASRYTNVNTPYRNYRNSPSPNWEKSDCSYQLQSYKDYIKQDYSFSNNNYGTGINNSVACSSDSDNPFKYDSHFFNKRQSQNQFRHYGNTSVSSRKDLNSNHPHDYCGHLLKSSDNNYLMLGNSDLWDNSQSQFDCVSSTKSLRSNNKLHNTPNTCDNAEHNCNCKSLHDELNTLKSMFSEFKSDMETIISGISSKTPRFKDSTDDSNGLDKFEDSTAKDPEINDGNLNGFNSKKYSNSTSQIKFGGEMTREIKHNSDDKNLYYEENIAGVPADVMEGYRAALTIKRMLHVKSMNSVVPAFTSFLHKRIN